MLKYISIFMLLVGLFACENKQNTQQQPVKTEMKNDAAKIKFIEIGSDKCVPCKQMKIVTDKITAKYKSQLDFEFIDVNKDDAAMERFKVQFIPSQVFIKDGKEIFKHTGYLPENVIDSLLQANGLKV